MEVLPIRNDIPSYDFTIEFESFNYLFEFRFNTRMGRWIMNINDENENPIWVGIPVLVDQDLTTFTFEGLPPGALICIDDTGEQRQPNKELFSTGLKLFYASQAEVEAIVGS